MNANPDPIAESFHGTRVCLSPHRVEIGRRDIDGITIAASSSDDLIDPAWDAFLQKCEQGQFQQSSMWAQAKQKAGWKPSRVLFCAKNRLIAGFQILLRKSKLGTIGYVSKGPVLDADKKELAEFVLELLCLMVRRNNIFALIIQPPDNSSSIPNLLALPPFLPNHISRVIEATLCIDTSQSMEEIDRQISQSTRNEARQASLRGITIRVGGEQDIPKFFELMSITCQRQRTKPNPPSSEALRDLWLAFCGCGARITFAEFAGQPVACALCIPFGRTVTFWKKGWSNEHAKRYPNRLLTREAIAWSVSNGYKIFDFVSLRRDTAISLLNGVPITDSQRKTRDFFHLCFGGFPKLLPAARVYIRNPALRLGYSVLMPFVEKARLKFST